MFTWNHASNTTFGIRNITLISGDYVHVAMEDGLPGGLANVDADVVAVGVKTLVNLLPDILQHDVHGLALVVGEVEVGSDVPLGDDERMTRGDRITVVECNTSGRLADDFHPTGKTAKWAFLAFHARKLVEMVILVEFVALVGNEALVRQFHITLVCVLLVDGVEPEAFFLKVAAHGKIGRSLR